MSLSPSVLAPALLILAALGSSTVADEAENYRRLQAMPRERRVALAENLERFDKLDAAEQAAIRKLDDTINRKDVVDQARYRAVLRRYHLWVNGLTDEQKQALKDAMGPEARFNLARKFRIKELEGGAPGPRIAGIQIGNYGLMGPYEVANILRVWIKLTPSKKAEIEKRQGRKQFFEEVKAQAKTLDVRFQHFPPAEERFYDSRLEGDEAFKNLFGSMSRRPDLTQKKAEAAPKTTEAAKKIDNQKRFEHPYAEFLYFQDHKPKAVAQKDLERFSASCPSWIHAMLDPLSPDDTREYLTIIYRLLYPPPTEMPTEVKSAAKPATNQPRASPRKAGAPGPS